MSQQVKDDNVARAETDHLVVANLEDPGRTGAWTFSSIEPARSVAGTVVRFWLPIEFARPIGYAAKKTDIRK